MSSEQNLVFAPLPGWEALEVNGADARDFLQRLTTVDLRNSAIGSFHPGLLLQANGKLILFFKLLQLDAQSFLLLMPPGLPPARESFDKFLFREKVTLLPRNNEWAYLRCLGDVASLKLPHPDKGQFAKLADGSIVMNEARWNAAGDFGWLVPHARAESAARSLQTAGWTKADTLEPYRIQALDPAVGAELGTEINPLEAGLSEIIPANKGCYPGQEVIERIRAMGQPPRKLAAVSGSGRLPTLPAKMILNGQEAGTLTSVASAPAQSGVTWIGLGLIKRTMIPANASSLALTVDDSPIEARIS